FHHVGARADQVPRLVGGGHVGGGVLEEEEGELVGLELHFEGRPSRAWPLVAPSWIVMGEFPGLLCRMTAWGLRPVPMSAAPLVPDRLARLIVAAPAVSAWVK